MAENNAAAETPRGDHSIADLRTMMRGETPKPAAAQAAETPAAETPTGAEAQIESVSGTEEKPGEQAAAAEPQRGPDGKFKPAEEVPAGVQKRIDKAVRAQREAERRATEAEAKLAANQASRPGEGAQPGAQAKPAAQPATQNAKPEVAKFDTYEEYVEALTDWKVDVARAKDRAEIEAARTQDAQQKAQTAHAARIAEAQKKYSDWEDVMEEAKELPLSRELHTAIVEREAGPDVAYFLATHPDEAKRINGLSPVSQLVEFGEIAARLTPKPETKPAADKKPLPKPPANVGGAAGAKVDQLDDPKISMETFKRLARAALHKAA